MILGEPNTGHGPVTTIEGLLRRAVTQRPDVIALIDPQNRETFTDGAPRRLSFAETDRIVSAIAVRLRELDLPTDSIVGIQLPNTVESILTVLGVLRAGMIAAPMPLLWRRADAANALSLIGAKAIITTSRIGSYNACATAMDVASDVFSVRHICSYGRNLPDGVVGLDDLFGRGSSDQPMSVGREGAAAAHLAVVTFDVTPDGAVAVARNHAELIAGGLAALLEGGIEADARILAGCATGSFAGLALTLMPWLLPAGTLSLHHAFDPDVFAAQCHDDRCDTVILPGPLIPHLAEARLLTSKRLRNVLALWRAPERRDASPPWNHQAATLTDVLAFGETALIGLRRGSDGRPVPLPGYAITAPRGASGAVPVAEFARTASGTLSLRGPMVPRHAFPPGAERAGLAHCKPDERGFVDTSYPCQLDRLTGTMTITGPPRGIASVGGYRFVLNELADTVRGLDQAAVVTALPDALSGHRLAGSSATEEIDATLDQWGVNPLLEKAFRGAA
jgi:hypothetical protein